MLNSTLSRQIGLSQRTAVYRLTAVRLTAVLLSAFLSNLARSQGVTTPRVPSPAATVSQTIGISTVSIDYSRPSVRGRVVWGDLVPYGWNIQGFGAGNSAPWRARANENTVIRFSHDVVVEGHPVPAGFNWQGYASAANYALHNKLNYDQALTWIDQAIAMSRNFTTLSIKSGLLGQTGKADEAAIPNGIRQAPMSGIAWGKPMRTRGTKRTRL